MILKDVHILILEPANDTARGLYDVAEYFEVRRVSWIL